MHYLKNNFRNHFFPPVILVYLCVLYFQQFQSWSTLNIKLFSWKKKKQWLQVAPCSKLLNTRKHMQMALWKLLLIGLQDRERTQQWKNNMPERFPQTADPNQPFGFLSLLGNGVFVVSQRTAFSFGNVILFICTTFCSSILFSHIVKTKMGRVN